MKKKVTSKILTLHTIITLIILLSISSSFAFADEVEVIEVISENNPIVTEIIPLVGEVDYQTTSDENPVVSDILPLIENDGVGVIVTDSAILEPVSENAEPLVLNVLVPMRVSVTIDPFELNGEGQIFSEPYYINNQGDYDVLLTFTDLVITYSDENNFEPLAHPFSAQSGSKLKSIYMLMKFDRNDMADVILTNTEREGEVTIHLTSNLQDDGNSYISFSFEGNVNELPDTAWTSGDVHFDLVYTLTPLLPPAEDIPDLSTEEKPADIISQGPIKFTTPAAINLSTEAAIESEITTESSSGAEVTNDAAPESPADDVALPPEEHEELLPEIQNNIGG
jgi:hypothetical protein